MIRARFAPLGALLLLMAAPLAAQDARDALIHSLDQEGHVSYAGLQTTTVSERGKTRISQQIVKRQAPNKLRIEYLAPARLRGELVIDDGEHLRHLIPSLRVVAEGPSKLRQTLRHESSRIQDVRSGKAPVTWVGESALLGRPVVVIQVPPAKPDRPVRTIWLDRETGVPLQVQDRSPGGRLIVTTFTRIDFAPILGMADFQMPVPAGFTVVPARLGRPIAVQRAEQTARRLWGGLPQPAYLPGGFTLTSATQLSYKKQPVIALHYTRGRDDLSLFVSAGAGEPFVAPVQPGLNVAQQPLGRVLVTLVGSLPPAELQRINASLRLPENPPPPTLVRRSQPK